MDMYTRNRILIALYCDYKIHTVYLNVSIYLFQWLNYDYLIEMQLIV